MYSLPFERQDSFSGDEQGEETEEEQEEEREEEQEEREKEEEIEENESTESEEETHKRNSKKATGTIPKQFNNSKSSWPTAGQLTGKKFISPIQGCVNGIVCSLYKNIGCNCEHSQKHQPRLDFD